MQEFQERNVFFDSTPMPDAEDFCRCRDWCVEDYDLTVWQPATGQQEVGKEQQVAQCVVCESGMADAEASIQAIETETITQAARMPEPEKCQAPMPTLAPVPKAAPVPKVVPSMPMRQPCRSCGNATVNSMFGVSYDTLVSAPTPAPIPAADVADSAQITSATQLQADIAQLTPSDDAYNDWLWPGASSETAIADVDNASGYEQELLHL